MKVAIAQINTTVGDIKGNADKITSFCSKARELGAELIVFPEMSLTGYPLKEIIESSRFVDLVIAQLNDLVGQLTDVQCIIGFVDANPLDEGKRFYNAAAVIQNGALSYVSYKCTVPKYDFYDQTDYFEPAGGPTIIKCSDKKVAITINEDIIPERFWPARWGAKRDILSEITRKKPDLIVNLCASPYSIGNEKNRIAMIKEQSLKYGVPIVVSNMVGAQDELVFDGSSFCTDAKGEIIARASSFKEDVVYIDLDYGAGDVHEEEKSEQEMIYKALVLGTKDYALKCGLKKALVGLDGGVDSALTLCVAKDALGAENITALVIRFSSTPESQIQDGLKLAQNLGVQATTINGQPIHESYVSALGSVLSNTKISTEDMMSSLLLAASSDKKYLILSSKNKKSLSQGKTLEPFCDLGVMSDLPSSTVYNIAQAMNSQSQAIPESILNQGSKEDRLNADQNDTHAIKQRQIGLRISTSVFTSEKENPIAQSPSTT